MGVENQGMQKRIGNHSEGWGGDFQPDGSLRQVRLDTVAREGNRYKGPEGRWPSHPSW